MFEVMLPVFIEGIHVHKQQLYLMCINSNYQTSVRALQAMNIQLGLFDYNLDV